MHMQGQWLEKGDDYADRDHHRGRVGTLKLEQEKFTTLEQLQVGPAPVPCSPPATPAPSSPPATLRPHRHQRAGALCLLSVAGVAQDRRGVASLADP